ncbi:hypothetical protein NQ315_009779 [Exocentrus adspersus]|uniref:Uncharacterized protein n=1 Tax=Exocentrus adspersus TaxID=1586481 RepID=A0AAV8WI56_9CUCU|nr:hypothetical protein NQ315_009779 [Exocentrus adspersus]
MKPVELNSASDKPDQEDTVVYNCTDDSSINVEISEVLTPATCAFLINEILQGILYQKCQIPYPYTWLKSVVNRKRAKDSTSENAVKKINFSAASHFRIVSTAYDILENVMKGIIKEFSERGDCIKEVVFVIGPTPQCPKEIYTINITSLAKGHLERNHANSLCKYRQKILRNIFLCQRWMDAVDNSMTCTNTFIFLKTFVTPSGSPNVDSSENIFVPSRPLTFPSKTKHIKINLNYEQGEYRNCCDGFFVFEDVGGGEAGKQRQNSESTEAQETVSWYQSKDLFKGFKDCYINKVSASELW